MSDQTMQPLVDDEPTVFDEPIGRPVTGEPIDDPWSHAIYSDPVPPGSNRRRPLGRRIVDRIIRRPKNWWDAPWTTERLVQFVTALIVVGGCTYSVVQVVHPALIFTNNTPTGGDMGAHVMAPAFLRDHLLPHLQLSGWSNYWYAGFPLYRFYMVVPALAIVALNVIFPYGIAFKIVAVLGLITLPFCCWCFGRLARFRYPMPELFALAALVFLYDQSFQIYGGNVLSTMAGEFSFSIALSLAMLGLGLFARGLETGKHRNWTAIVLALAMLCHGIVLIFVILGAVLMWLVWMDKTRFIYGLTMGLTAMLLSAFWVVPFLANHAYMTDMKYGFRPNGGGDSFWDMFFPWTTFLDILVSGFAIMGFVVSVAKRHVNGAWLGITCLALIAAVYVTRDSLPLIGLLWNPRLLPFLYLVRLLLMMVGIVETASFVARNVSDRRFDTARARLAVNMGTAIFVTLVVLVCELFSFQQVPGGRYESKSGKLAYTWGIGGFDPIALSSKASDNYSDGWTRYNFTGYEAKGAYGEYRNLVQQMATLGKEQQHGCGRALWENNKDNGTYGTTMALMLLPHWTDGCITSMEGLFFEASGTTPYHFITASAMSAHSSDPVRELRYQDNDAAVGVPHMADLGVRYLMVFTEAAKKQADSQSKLALVATVGPWNIYELATAHLVEPLTVQPVVVNARGGDQRERNLELGTSWFQHRDEWAAMPADSGPVSWQRIDVDVDVTRRIGEAPGSPGRKVDIVVPRQPIVATPLPPVAVSNVRLGEQDLSFTVDQIGVPVLVRMSYFPNWEVDGADGPYRIAPNLMVVVPTSTNVRLHYGRSALDLTAYGLTIVGIALLVFLRRRGDVRHRSLHPYAVLGPETDNAGDQWARPRHLPYEPEPVPVWRRPWDDGGSSLADPTPPHGEELPALTAPSSTTALPSTLAAPSIDSVGPGFDSVEADLAVGEPTVQDPPASSETDAD